MSTDYHNLILFFQNFRIICHLDVIFFFYFLYIYQWIVECGFVTCSYQIDIEIGYFCVSDIIAVWLEREAENQHVSLRSLELSAFRCILNLSCHPYRHLLVNLAGCREQRWYHVNLLCLVNQVVWVYRDAVAANESWNSWHEVPFCASCRRYVFDVDVHLVKNLFHLVEEGYLYISLAVLHQFTCLCYFDTLRLVGAMGKYRSIETVDDSSCFGCRTAGNLHDVLNGMNSIARIDALWREAYKETLVQLQS